MYVDKDPPNANRNKIGIYTIGSSVLDIYRIYISGDYTEDSESNGYAEFDKESVIKKLMFSLRAENDQSENSEGNF